MSSPIPPDPYEALGVSKDAEISAIRTAHRKLVLKHHPDRIKDPALKERGKDAFQKIQVAYELLSDPIRRQRYHDQLKLAELRKEAMMREPPSRTHAYPSRHTQSASTSREWNSDDQTYYELRKPKDASYFDSKERFEEPQRASSRKYPEYERSSSAKKSPSEAPRGDANPRAKAAWGAAYAAVNFGIKVKKEADKKKETKSHVKEQELRDREIRKARQEKEQQTRRQFVESEDDSGSDTATRVTSSTIRPSKPSPRPTREREPQRASGATRHHAFADDDSDQESTHSRKWESHHERTREYLAKAASMAGARPNFDRSDSASYWNGRKSMDENVRRPTSSRGRHEYDEPPARPSIPTHTSAPSNLKSRVDDRADPRPRRSATGSHPIHERDNTDHRKEIPGFHRAQTMPTPRSSSKKDAAPSKSSNLKHTETHDSGYGSSSSPHTPEMRGESPSHRPKETKTKYQIVDPESEDDTRSRIRPVDSSDSDNRRRRYRSQEPVRRESDRRREKSDRPEGPKLSTDMRSKTTREALSDRPKMRHSETSRYDARSPRDSPPLSRQGSGRDKLPFEVSDGEREPSRYQYTPKEKIDEATIMPLVRISRRMFDIRQAAARLYTEIYGKLDPTLLLVLMTYAHDDCGQRLLGLDCFTTSFEMIQIIRPYDKLRSFYTQATDPQILSQADAAVKTSYSLYSLYIGKFPGKWRDDSERGWRPLEMANGVSVCSLWRGRVTGQWMEKWLAEGRPRCRNVLLIGDKHILKVLR